MNSKVTNDVLLLRLLSVFATVVLASQPVQSQTPNFITVDPPQSGFTQVYGINNKGVMVGEVLSLLSGEDEGFLLQNGAFTLFEFGENTNFNGINDNGDVVGIDCNGSCNNWNSFLYSQGASTPIVVPNATDTFAQGINNVGQVVGYYYDTSGNYYGFLLSAGLYSKIDYPGSKFTYASGINNVGAIVGQYENFDGSVHGFLLQNFLLQNETFKSIDYPGATVTVAYGINDGGQIVGEWGTTDSHALGFEYNPASPVNNGFTTIDFPAVGSGSLAVYGMNDAGQLAGGYSDSESRYHGFVLAVGPFAYVANSSSASVSMVDIPTSLPVTTITVGSGPSGIAVSPDGSQVYVSNYTSNSVSVIGTTSTPPTVTATVQNIQSPLGVAFTPPDGIEAYVVNGSANMVSVIDTTTSPPTVVGTVPVGTSPVGVAMAYTSQGTFAYVTNSGTNNVSVIAVGNNPTVVKTLNVGSEPSAVAVTPNSSLAYVTNLSSGTISIISVATNTVTATITVGTNPSGVAFTPDSNFAYVANSGSNSVSVIDTTTSTVVNTVTGFNQPVQVALSTDGAYAYVTNGNGTVSVIATASNTIVGAPVAVGSSPTGVAIQQVPQTELQITQPLSPTQPNNFDFGTNNYQVQYPPGTQFSGVYMTITSVPITQAQFQQRVAGTAFAGAACVVYAGAGGNCVDDQVTCSNSPSGIPLIDCPSSQQLIDVQTSFTTSQSIVNPAYLTAPIGQNQWQNIFSDYIGQGPLITIKGKTTGFSEFVAVDLGTGDQGQAQFQILNPVFPQTYSQGQVIPISIQLLSVDPPHNPITGAQANISVVMIADGLGNPQQKEVFSQANAFTGGGNGIYNYSLNATSYAAGIYSVTIYGQVFPVYQGQFTLQGTGEPFVGLSATTLNFGTQIVGTTSAVQTVTMTNTGSGTLSNISVSAAGDFAQMNNCGSSLGAGSNCTISVTYTPTVVGNESGSVSISDNAAGSPQQITLTGTGVPAVAVSPSTLSFTPQLVNTASATQTVTLTNYQVVPVNIGSISTSGPFSETDNCANTQVPAGGTCSINVTFAPTASGPATGSVVVTDSGPGGSPTVQLSGTGSGTVPNGFVDVSSMNFPRAQHEETLLSSGGVLITGGTPTTAAGQLYNPATTNFTVTANNMSTTRTWHRSRTVGKGDVLVLGGVDSSGNFLASADLYDSKTNMFSPTGSMSTPRAMPTATWLGTPRVLLVTGGLSSSGSDGPLSSAETYDPGTGTFTLTTGSMYTPRYNHAASELQDGTVLITGGRCDPSPDCVPDVGISAEIFDPNTGLFTRINDMNVSRVLHTSTLLANGNVLITGGSTGTEDTAEIYNFANQTFIPTATEMVGGPLMGHRATALSTGKIGTYQVLITGGNYTAEAQVYDPTYQTFTAVGSLTTPRSFHTATLVKGGVIVTGGSDEPCEGALPNCLQPWASAELYTLEPLTVTLTPSMNPAYLNEPVTFSVVVGATGPTPTGSVSFKEGKTILGTVPLVDGQASLTTKFAKTGTFSIVARYLGDQNYEPQNSNTIKEVVELDATSTALASSVNPSSYGQAVTFTATVSSAGPTPTGTVTFKNGSKSIGSATLSGGVAAITVSTLPVGTSTITASYGGDSEHAKSTSPPLEQVVNQATSTTTVVSSVNPSQAGEKVTFTATVTSPTTTPTGTVKFMDGGTELGTGNLKKGKASYSTSTLSVGSHNITAVYEGNANISGSTSTVLVQTVN